MRFSKLPGTTLQVLSKPRNGSKAPKKPHVYLPSFENHFAVGLEAESDAPVPPDKCPWQKGEHIYPLLLCYLSRSKRNLDRLLPAAKAQESVIKNVIRRSTHVCRPDHKMGYMPEKVTFALPSSYHVVMRTTNHR